MRDLHSRSLQLCLLQTAVRRLRRATSPQHVCTPYREDGGEFKQEKAAICYIIMRTIQIMLFVVGTPSFLPQILYAIRSGQMISRLS